jgi:hypothetical protein
MRAALVIVGAIVFFIALGLYLESTPDFSAQRGQSPVWLGR